MRSAPSFATCSSATLPAARRPSREESACVASGQGRPCGRWSHFPHIEGVISGEFAPPVRPGRAPWDAEEVKDLALQWG